MNQKMAKKLRKIARGIVTTVEQDTKKTISDSGYVTRKEDKAETPQVFVQPDTWKAAYRTLKKRTGQ